LLTEVVTQAIEAVWATGDRKRGLALATAAADALRPDRSRHEAMVVEIEQWIADGGR